ncbi:hypothetical protein GCM10010321_42440 [Streptomyces chartreusis]|nr:hypothetical protein GCM10010321_42440 [Streptomyces chartreusis]
MPRARARPALLGRPDAAYIPIHDAPLSRWALTWHTSSETDQIRNLAKVVEELGPMAL